MRRPGPSHPDWPKVLALRRVLERDRRVQMGLRGMCGTAAAVLDSLIPSARPVIGTFFWFEPHVVAYTGKIEMVSSRERATHCWVHWGDYLLDITATQFPPYTQRPILLLHRESREVMEHYTPRLVGAEAEEGLREWLTTTTQLNDLRNQTYQELRHPKEPHAPYPRAAEQPKTPLRRHPQVPGLRPPGGV